MVAVVRVDTELVDHLEGILAPVLDVDEREVQRRAIVASKAVTLAKCSGSGEDIGCNDLVHESIKFSIRELSLIHI